MHDMMHSESYIRTQRTSTSKLLHAPCSYKHWAATASVLLGIFFGFIGLIPDILSMEDTVSLDRRRIELFSYKEPLGRSQYLCRVSPGSHQGGEDEGRCLLWCRNRVSRRPVVVRGCATRQRCLRKASATEVHTMRRPSCTPHSQPMTGCAAI